VDDAEDYVLVALSAGGATGGECMDFGAVPARWPLAGGSISVPSGNLMLQRNIN
jgi:hypothetical protein